ncbi:aminopeptidase N-like isoform X2 [Temnothorax nylanderi]
MIGARRIFPCWDKPTFKATFNISIKHLSKHPVLSTYLPVRITQTSNNLKRTLFDITSPIPAYLIAIVVSNVDFNPVISNEIINLYSVRHQTALHLRYANMVIERVTLHLKSEWRSKELLKVNHVAIPGFLQESTNKLDFIYYRETALIYDEELDPIIREIDVTRLVTRAVVHQCWDKVSSSLWSQPLKEGILTLYATNTINKTYPEFRIWDLFVVQIQQESLRLDTLDDSIIKPLMPETTSTTCEINSLLSFSCYIKAPTILRMLQHILGYDIFWNGIEKYLNNREYESLSNFNDFWTTMQITLDHSNSVYKFNIEEMMNPWIQLKHYPVLNVTEFELANVKIFNNNAQTMNIPVTFTTQDHCNFNDTSPYLTPQWIHTTSIILPSNVNSWMLINIQQTGYYRVNYDAVYWKRIVNYLTSDEYTKIHVLNRAQIIDDAFYFLMHGQLPLSTFLELTKYLQRETDYVAWYPMFKALEYVSGFFLFKESAYIKKHMRDILQELLKHITYTEKSDEKPNDLIKCLRQEAAKWACVLEDSNCQHFAAFKLKQHLDDIEPLLPEWKKWVYCNALVNNDTLWRNVFDTWVNETDICSSKMPDCKNATMQPKDRVNSFLHTVAKHAKDNDVLEYILKNFGKIIPRGEVGVKVVLVNIINHVQSKEQLDKVLEFVKYKRGGIKDSIDTEWEPDYQGEIRELKPYVNRFLKYIDVTLLAAEQTIKSRLSKVTNPLNYFQHLVRN